MEVGAVRSALEILEGSQFLSSDQAIMWLAERGVRTSRSGLDRARKSGRLNFLKVSGKVRILYNKEELANAFVTNLNEYNATFGVKQSNTISQNDAYQKALILCVDRKKAR